IGDFGQDRAPGPTPDADCVARFGQEQDIGGFRAQSLGSLSGKILRIDPDNGEGICPDATRSGSFAVMNPYCDGSGGRSHASKIYGYGCRNPFRAAIRPKVDNSPPDGTPGIIYFGDVGRQGYEEINTITTNDGPNFGWPCWEGPLPGPQYRDSP